MSNINIDHPYLFLLIIPLLIGVIIPFVKMKNGKKNPKNIASLVIHILLAVLITTSISDIKILHASQNSEIYVVADVSYSDEQELDKIDEHINKIHNLLDLNSKMGVVCFGKNSSLFTPLGENIRSVKDALIDKSSSDIEGALRYTASLFSKNVIKKMILITDGAETDNQAIRAVDDLQSQNIIIDAIYLDHELSKNEIQINGVDYIYKTYMNKEKEEVKVSLQAGGDMENVSLFLFEDDKVIDEKELSLNKGIHIESFPLNISTSGVHKYQVKVNSANDEILDNNTYYFVQEVVDHYKVMVVGEKYSNCMEVKSLYNESCEVDTFFNGEDIPYKIEELCSYDEFVFNNINLISLNHYEEVVTNLEKVISTYGKSLITLGSTYASGTSSNIMSKYNNMLPVQFETSDAKCLALVIDASSSMEDDNRLEKAQEGAIACLDLLGEKDYVTVITFGEKTSVIQPLTSAKNREQIVKAINSIKVSYATNMSGGLNEAYKQIRNANFENKNMIVLTDGVPGDAEELPRVVTNISNDNIAISFLNISNKQGEPLLKELSSLGTGAYYYIQSSTDIVDVILTSVADVITNTRIEGDFTINTKRSQDPLIEGVNNLPNIKGYNYSRIKGSASTIYTITYTNELGGQKEVPLLAYWTFGKGKVISYTSDISIWGKDLIESPQGKRLFNNIITYLEPNERIDNIYDIKIDTKGFSSEIKIDLDMKYDNAYLELIITDPNNNKSDSRYFRNDTTTYNIVVSTESIGLYKLNLIYHYENKDYAGEKYFSFSYSKEYDYFNSSNEELLYLLIGEEGNVLKDESYSLTFEEANLRYYESINLYIILAMGVLFIIDIMIRKLRFSDFKISRRKK